MKTTHKFLAAVLVLASTAVLAHDINSTSSFADVAGNVSNTLSTSATAHGNSSVDVTAVQWAGSAGSAGSGVSVQTGHHDTSIDGGLNVSTDNWSGSNSSISTNGHGAHGTVYGTGTASGTADAGYNAKVGRNVYLGQNAQAASGATTQQHGQGNAFAESVNALEGSGSVSVSGSHSSPSVSGSVSDVKTSASTAVNVGRHSTATTSGDVTGNGWYGAGAAGNGGDAGNSGE